MEAVVVALVFGVVALFVRAAQRRTARDGSWVRAGLVAVVSALLVAWFAVDELTVGSAELARTADDVYTVRAPDDVPGPLGLLAATQLELNRTLRLEQRATRDTTTARETSFELSDRFLGITVGRACITERVAQVDSRDSRSYDVDAGSCPD